MTHWKRPWDAGKDWRWEDKGKTEDEMFGWHQQLDGHEFEQASGVGDGQGSLVCCNPWIHKGLDTTERLNWLNCLLSLPACITFTNVAVLKAKNKAVTKGANRKVLLRALLSIMAKFPPRICPFCRHNPFWNGQCVGRLGHSSFFCLLSTQLPGELWNPSLG